MKKSLFSGTLILVFGGFFCKLIGALYRVPLSNIIGIEGLGIYQLIFPIYAFFLVFISGGIGVALSKIVAEERAKQNFSLAKKYLKVCVISLFVISLVCSLIFYFCSGIFANLQGNAKAEIGYKMVSIALLFAGIIPAYRGYFQGFENMVPTVVSQLFEQVCKLVLGLLFAMYLLPNGVEFAVLGTIFGITCGEIISLIYLFIKSKITNKKLIGCVSKNQTFWKCFKRLYKLSAVITFNSMIMPLILALDSLIIVNLLVSSGLTQTFATGLYGVYSGVINSLINFPSVFAIAIATAIVPSISFSNSVGKNSSKNISISIKVLLLICLPCFFVFVVFAPEIIKFLFPNNVVASQDFLFTSSMLLRLCSINVFYISLIYLTTAIFQAFGKPFLPLLSLIFGGCVRILLTILLVKIPSVNIYGAGIASLTGFGICALFNVFKLKKLTNFCIRKREILSLSISCLMFGSSLAVMKIIFNDLNYILSMGLSVLLSSIVFAICIFLLPTFSENEYSFIPFGQKLFSIKLKFFKKKFKNNIAGENLLNGGSDE